MYSSLLNEIPVEKIGLAVRSILLMIDLTKSWSYPIGSILPVPNFSFFSFRVLQIEVDPIHSDPDSVDAPFHARHLPDICVPAIWSCILSISIGVVTITCYDEKKLVIVRNWIWTTDSIKMRLLKVKRSRPDKTQLLHQLSFLWIGVVCALKKKKKKISFKGINENGACLSVSFHNIKCATSRTKGYEILIEHF